MDFDAAFTKLLGHEGAYSDHPSDPGGATMWGITERVARENGYTGSMRELPQSLASTIYRQKYWDVCKCDKLPADVRFAVFDAAVNSGTVQASKWLQRSVGAIEDGVIGPRTLASAGNYPAWIVSARYSGHRLKFMTDLPTWSSFGKGWARRIAQNLMEA